MDGGAPSPLAGRRAAVGLAVGLALAPVFVGAGAMGMPALLLLTAIIVCPRPALWLELARPAQGRAALLAALAFLLWASASQAWSLAGPRQILTTWAVVLVGTATLLAAAHLPAALHVWPRRLYAGLVAALAVALAGESLLGGVFTYWVNGFDRGAGIAEEDYYVVQTVGRASVAAALLAGPAIAMALGMGGRWRWCAGIILLGVTVACVSFDMTASVLIVGAGCAALIGALRAPRTALRAVGATVAVWLAAFPFFVALVRPLGERVRHSLPFSWELRWEAWTYAVEEIVKRPLWGWGVDAAREFGQRSPKVLVRGFELERMPLHTHSASLQVWLELGVIGVMLCAAMLLLAAGRVASAPRLGRMQAAGAAWVFATAVGGVFVSYGVWQEWLWGAAFLAAAACFLTPEPVAPEPVAPERGAAGPEAR